MSTMATRERYFKGLNGLLEAMPPGEIDMDQIEAHQRRYGYRFADPSEIVERWLLDQQRRVQNV
jgi:hypothetical protein